MLLQLLVEDLQLIRQENKRPPKKFQMLDTPVDQAALQQAKVQKNQKHLRKL
jgi:hypothetical protein